MWNEPKLCTKGVSLPDSSSTACDAIALWLKMGVGGGAFMAVLLISLTCYFWKKNKRSVTDVNQQGMLNLNPFLCIEFCLCLLLHGAPWQARV